MSASGITLRMQVGGFRWALTDRDRVEVWGATGLVGTLSGRMLHTLVAHELQTAEMVTWLLRETAPQPAERGPGRLAMVLNAYAAARPEAPDPPPAAARPLAILGPPHTDPDLRARLRARRHSRKEA